MCHRPGIHYWMRPSNFSKASLRPLFLKDDCHYLTRQAVSLACIASTAFKGMGESIVVAGDTHHISKQTGLNAYIKSESFAGTGNISYLGVTSTCRPWPAMQKKMRHGALLFYAPLLKCPEILMRHYKKSFCFSAIKINVCLDL